MKEDIVKALENPWRALIMPMPEYRLSIASTALLVIDMQYLDAHPDHGMLRHALEKGMPEEAYHYYKNRLNLITVNIQQLLEAFRSRSMRVIYVKIQSLTKHGQDRSCLHKLFGVEAQPDSRDGRILEEIAPWEDDVVISKTASGAFTSTNIDYVLRNLGIKQLVVAGVLTNYCVETAVRDAADLGYEVILVEDGCASITEAMHLAAISILSETYAKVRNTEDIISELGRLSD